MAQQSLTHRSSYRPRHNGDDNPENDRLRYRLVLRTPAPHGASNGRGSSLSLPTRGQHGTRDWYAPPLIDLALHRSTVWNNFFWIERYKLFLRQLRIPIKASSRTYRRNLADYRRTHVVAALAVLSLYEATEKAPSVFTEAERSEIQGRLLLSDKMFGGIVGSDRLPRVVAANATQARDIRGHNWELLRQRAEAEALYFEPLTMPDGSATHAMLWFSRADLEDQATRRFEARFWISIFPGATRSFEAGMVRRDQYLTPKTGRYPAERPAPTGSR